jgi:EAL domain-containing protein (putative c-di-GMP-specific phosphodiesterase class I)
VLKAKFRSEAFVEIGSHSDFSGFEELLCVHENPESFFTSATNAQIHQIFSEAFDEGVGRSVTINIQPSALFDKDFLQVLSTCLENYPQIDRHRVCIEITEHGGIPENFNPKILQYLKDINLKLALDDFDPRKPDEITRLEMFAPYIDIIKFPYQVMEALRDKNTHEDMSALVRSICLQYPDKVIVMEGVGKDELADVSLHLNSLGINYVQISRYQETFPSHPMRTSEPAPVLALTN